MRRTPTAIGLALAVLMAGCRSVQREDTVDQPPPIAVTTVTVAAADLHERFEAGGLVAASESAAIAARILAPVQDVRVRAGDRVRAGEVLVTLDARDLAAQVRQGVAAAEAAEQELVQARNERAAAVADHTLAVASQGRIAALHARNSATAQELDDADARKAGAAARLAAAAAAVDRATAHVAAMRAAADAATVTESFTVIRAPYPGIVTERLVDPGTLAVPGLPLLRLDADGRRRVELRVDEARVEYVRPGDHVTVILGAAGEDAIIDGTVSEVARAVSADQRAFTVKIELPAPATPRTGTYARVRFRGEQRRSIVVPAGALRHQGQVTSVFIVEDDVAHIRLVRPGSEDDERVEIVAGLNAGELVIVNPPSGLLDGRRVSVTTAGGRR